MDGKKLHVAIISSPGTGHLIPVLLLGNRLATHHNLRVTILAVTTAESQPPTNNTQLPVINIPAADISGVVAPAAKVETRLNVMMRETLPILRSVISSMDPRPDVLIGDVFSTASWTVADEFQMSKYLFVASTAWFVGLAGYSPVLDKEVVGQYVDQTEPFKVPGCKPVRPEDVVDPMLDRANERYQEYLQIATGVTRADGMLLNTWEDLEPQSLDALRNNEILRSVVRNQPIYTIGPVYKKYQPTGLKDKVIKWLDKQPEKSVIYVSFGSGGTLSAEQMTELAYGLELSRQKFVWVVRPPNGYVVDGTFFDIAGGPSRQGSDGPPNYLPDRFLARIEKIGLVVPLWAPQTEILNHSSIGGFLTHCGWNSVLESIMSGVPMIAWPLYAEQRMNATLLVEELKVASRPTVWPTKEVVGREEIEKMMRSLMESEEGEAMRERVKELRDSGEEALSVKGSSHILTCKFIESCWSQIQ